jgi:FkbM family methyltransferase
MAKLLKRLRRRVVRLFRGESGQAENRKRSKREQAKDRMISGQRFARVVAAHDPAPLIEQLPHSKAQYWQDLFVLSQLNFKRNGYFVEFGATNGVSVSNTYLLEQQYGWSGIVAEPARCWHADLLASRRCRIETRCVWARSGLVLPFTETTQPVFSTLAQFESVDRHAAKRQSGIHYEVPTISLLDLMREHEAPQRMDYLSIDTEGSEYDILSAFDFERYRFAIITCEHNFTPMRQKLYELLTGKGYERRFENISACDDWYVDAKR